MALLLHYGNISVCLKCLLCPAKRPLKPQVEDGFAHHIDKNNNFK